MTKLIERYKLYKKRKRTADELYSLTDYELRDLGIHRGQIPDIVRTIY